MSDPNDTKGPETGRRGGSLTADLNARIKKMRSGRAAQEAANRVRRAEMTGAGRAFRLASEFVAAIVVGALIGYGLDLLFGTSPWLLVVLLLLGFAAGVLNVIRATAEMNAATAVPPGTPAVADDEDEDQ